MSKRTTKIVDSRDQNQALTVWHRKGGARSRPSIRVVCACCDQDLVICHEANPDFDGIAPVSLEINGVMGTVDQWQQIFLPLLGLELEGAES